MKIRAAGASDIKAMHALRLRVRENRLSDPGRLTEKDYPAYLGRNAAWIAETERGLAGFAILDVDGGRIWALFVAPEAEGSGIGRALHARLIESAIEHGLRRLVLSTAPRTRAERFYTETGWTRAGTTPTGELLFELDAFS